MEAMRKFLVTVFLAALPLLADDSTKLEIRVTNEAGRPIENASVVIKFRGGVKVKPNPKFRKEWDVRTSQQGLVKLPPSKRVPS